MDGDVLSATPAKMDITIAMDDVDNFLEMISEKMQNFVAQNGLNDSVKVGQDENGVSLSIQDVVLFDTGSADVRMETQSVMRELGALVAEFGMPVVVAGHTDNQPISTVLYPSNWELSSARASTVTRIILDQGLEPSFIHVEGFGENKPIADNETAEGRADNRRVELLYTRQDVRSEMIEQQKN